MFSLQDLKNKLWLILVVPVLLLLVVGALLVNRQTTPLIVVSIQPEDGAINLPLTSNITTVFNQGIKPEMVQFKFEPQAQFTTKYGNDKKTLILDFPQGLKSQTKYSLEIIDVQGSQALKTIFFSTLATTFDVGLYKELQTEQAQDYTLLPYLPHEEKDFFIKTYVGPRKLWVTIVGQDAPQKRQEALDWMKSKGVDPQTHEINWASIPSLLNNFLPYEAKNFRIEYDLTYKTYLIHFLYNPAQNTSADEQFQKAKDDSIAWIKSKGFDPETLPIEWLYK